MIGMRKGRPTRSTLLSGTGMSGMPSSTVAILLVMVANDSVFTKSIKLFTHLVVTHMRSSLHLSPLAFCVLLCGCVVVWVRDKAQGVSEVKALRITCHPKNVRKRCRLQLRPPRAALSFPEPWKAQSSRRR